VLFDQILTEWPGRRKLLGCSFYIDTLARKIVGNGAPQGGIGDEMRRIGSLRQVAARELVFALGAGFDTIEPMDNRVIDGLVVAEFKMKEGMMFDGAPIAAIKRILADEVERAADPAAGAACHHQ